MKKQAQKKKHREKLEIALGRDPSAMPYSKKSKKIQKIPREHDYFMGFSQVRQKKKNLFRGNKPKIFPTHEHLLYFSLSIT